MNKARNLSFELDRIILSTVAEGKKPRLLLHACCAPCASYAIAYLKDFFDIKVIYFNPNIDGIEEYNRRSSELERFIKEFSPAITYQIFEFQPQQYFDAVKGFEKCVEGGERCLKCFALRLDFTARMASDEGFDYFASTLSISPHKDSNMLAKIGEAAATKYNTHYLPNDFKKKNGYLESTILSKRYNLYRQNYCGCVFSKNAAEKTD